MFCSICGIEIDSIDDAIAEGWLPSFYDGDFQHEVACPSCSETILQVSADGEFEVKPEYQGKIVYMDSESKEYHHVMGIALTFDARNN